MGFPVSSYRASLGTNHGVTVEGTLLSLDVLRNAARPHRGLLCSARMVPHPRRAGAGPWYEPGRPAVHAGIPMSVRTISTAL